MNQQQKNLIEERLKFWGVKAYTIVGVTQNSKIFVFGKECTLSGLNISYDKQDDTLYVESFKDHNERLEEREEPLW